MISKALVRLSRSNIFWHQHQAHHSAQDDIEEFLIKNAYRTLFIKHKMAFTGDTSTTAEAYHNSQQIYHRKIRGLQVPKSAIQSNMTSFEFLLSLKEVIVSLYLVVSYVLRTRSKFDIGIGVDPVTGFFAILVHKLGIAKHAIFAPTDYTVKRFGSPLLNSFYKFAFKLTVINSSCIWVNNKMLRQIINTKITNAVPIVYVPIGAYVPKSVSDKKEQNSVVFNRMLVKPNGADVAIEAMTYILKHIRDAKLHIIGYGPLEQQLQNMAKTMMLQNHVVFHGYREHDEVIKILQKCVIGIAPYMPTSQRLIQTNWAYADHSAVEFPASVRECLAFGLPIVITRGMGFADVEVKRHQIGMTVEYDPENLAQAVIHLLSNREVLEKCSENAKKYSEGFDWNRTLPRAFEETFEHLDRED